MGFSHSWIAVQGLAREQALEALGMAVEDARADILEGVAMFDWSDDWLVLLSDDDEDAARGDLAELGRLGRGAVAYSVNQDAPYASACGYADGEDVWVVTVKPSQGRFTVVGQPPEQLDSIIAAAKAGQDDSEIDLFFDIPATLAESICGFRLGKGDPEALHHVSLKPSGLPRQSSARNAEKQPGFFARLFGRG